MNIISNEAGERASSQSSREISSALPDADLLISLSTGKEEAFWHLWNRYKKGLHRICLRIMGGNVADAEDALSEVMLKALDRLRSCAGKIVNLEAWLHRLARNLCIDLRREHRRRFETAEGSMDTELAEIKSERSGPDAEVENEIQNRIATLPHFLREPFVLHVLRGIPSRQVAAQLGLSPSNVRKRVQLARVQLRREIESVRDGHDDAGLVNRSPRPAATAGPSPDQAKPSEYFPLSGIVCTVCVRLPCGVEQLFHVFPAHAPFAQGRRMKALHLYLQNHPGSWRKRLELAELHQIGGDWIEAVGEWRRVLEARPFLPAALSLGDTLLKLGEPVAAANVFREARRKLFEPAAVGRHLDGWEAFCQKDAGRSVKEFQAAADLEPNNPAHFHSLALAHRMAGARPKALAAIKCALHLNPDDPVALSHGHEMLIAAGQVEEAIRRAHHLLKLHPLDLLTGWRLVDCRCRLGLTQGEAGIETKLLLRRMANISPNKFLMREPRAALLISRGEPQKALDVHRRFIEQHSQCPRGQERYSRLLTKPGFIDCPPAMPRILNLSMTYRCNGACDWCGKNELPGG